MTLSLQVVDNGDGTGGVATVAGSSGAAVSLYCAPYTNAQGGLAWSLAGSRTGDGTLAVTPGNGFYFWYAASGGLVSNPANQNLSDGKQSVHYRCLLAVQAQIQLLCLPGIGPDSVLVLWLELEDKPLTANVPAIGICPVGREGQPGILTGKDDIEYPVLVGINAVGVNDYKLGLAARLLWRQQIFRAFRNQRLPGVPEVVTTQTDPDAVIDKGWFKKSRFVSALLFKFRSRELRGFGN